MSATSAKVGRPLYVATDQQRQLVTILRANGIGPEHIARELEISRRTLNKHFRDELAHGKERVVAKIGSNVLLKAMGGKAQNGTEKIPDNACMFYWLSRHGGPAWQESTRTEHSGRIDATVTIKPIEQWSTAELERLAGASPEPGPGGTEPAEEREE